MSVRVVAVLGYGGGGRLHPVAAARVRQAEQLAGADDVVLLSGWGRRGRPSEAGAMLRAWGGPAARVVADPYARSTLDNLDRAVALAREVGASRVVAVTSVWHAPRARALARRSAAPDVAVEVVGAGDRGALRDRARELACWALLPVQAHRHRRGA